VSQQQQQQQQQQLVPAGAFALQNGVGEAGAISGVGVRRMVGACVEMVSERASERARAHLGPMPSLLMVALMHLTTLAQRRTPPPPLHTHTQVEEILTQQPPPQRAMGLARSSGESVASGGGSVASASLVEAGRARVLQKEVAILRAKLQVRHETGTRGGAVGRRSTCNHGMCRHTHTDTDTERERERETNTDRHIHTHIYIYTPLKRQALRDVHGTLLNLLNSFEGRFRDERGLGFSESSTAFGIVEGAFPRGWHWYLSCAGRSSVVWMLTRSRHQTSGVPTPLQVGAPSRWPLRVEGEGPGGRHRTTTPTTWSAGAGGRRWRTTSPRSSAPRVGAQGAERGSRVATWWVAVFA
jgi:hypothetical protein